MSERRGKRGKGVEAWEVIEAMRRETSPLTSGRVGQGMPKAEESIASTDAAGICGVREITLFHWWSKAQTSYLI